MFTVDKNALWCDEAVKDDKSNWLFLSLWGRDSAMRKFEADITLKKGGATCILKDKWFNTSAQILVAAELRKREIKVEVADYGEMVHTLFYSKYLEESGKTSMVLSDDQDQIWQAIKLQASIPLADAWKDSVLSALDPSMLSKHDGEQSRLSITEIKVDQEWLAGFISTGLKSGILPNI